MGALQYFIYLSVAVLLLGLLFKAIKIARMPIHLRWDLYPIPHEKGKGHYGGSYFEELDWWTKPLKVSLVSEVKEMSKEILLIQSLFHHNRFLWFSSFPFHFGLYLLVGYLFILLLGAILNLSGIVIGATSESAIGVTTHYLTVITGAGGAILGAIGAVGLILSRIFKGELRRFSVKADFFNLALLLALFVSLLISLVTVDKDGALHRSLAGNLITFKPMGEMPSPIPLELFLAGFFFLYLPFTHMTHFVGKYFTYHKVRWEDHPNLRGSKIEKAVTEYLGYKLSWSAAHIKPGSTWAEAATDTSPVTGEEKKK